MPLETPCKVAFVAEAPAEDEEYQRKPLVGASGRVYNALLKTAGIVRADHFTGNVFDVRLPGDEVANWCARVDEMRTWKGYSLPPIGDKGYLRPEFLHHLDRLGKEIKTVRPNVIVPMGGTALWALTGISTITKARGAVSRATYVAPGVKILPTFHPAHIMRYWKMYPVMVGDFVKAIAEAEFPEVRRPTVEIWVEPTLADLDCFYTKYLEPAPLWGSDIETGWGQITCISFAPDGKRAIVVPFVDTGKPSRSYWRNSKAEVLAWEWVKARLEDPNHQKVFQNGPYDTFWNLALMGIRTMNYRHDTRLLHHVLYPELPKDLGFMGASYTDHGPWKLMRPRKGDKRDE